MDFRSKNIFTGVLFILLIGGSMVFSTLHSHHEIEWNQPDRHLSTGHCLTTDETVCPICGYLFDTDFDAEINCEPHFFAEAFLSTKIDLAPSSFSYLFDQGRSPPTHS